MTDSPEAPTPRDPDALIRRAGVRADTDRDQHFLVDDRVLDRIPGYAEVFDADVSGETGDGERGSEGDGDRDANGEDASSPFAHVLEIGAGPGALTDRLLAVADEVTVVERDPDLAAHLREEFREEIDAGRLTVVEGDALSVDLPDFSACISNLPYGVSSEIAFRLLPKKKPLVLMFQKEFADRMAAEAGSDDYGRLSVTAQHYADVEVVEPVPKEAFSPAPRVQSAVVRTTPRDPDYEVDDEAFFLRFVKALFTQRRKTLRNAIRNTPHISGLDDADAVVDAIAAGETDLDPDVLGRRAGEIPPKTFAALAEVAAEYGVDRPREAGETT
ncbi:MULTISPECIES: 16S rRNA (adenine(1518)-N(6)/adenine(1519)-N(6))-dimethyltransferase RsmA [Halorussus]|uniref:16S rRNA (adenine(1518)-N(6)/adenine(1519)-N(6))- dimethyltransferase RsmA n=1 Tax=Halorussus TaxID=1070314 RepID=UPI00209E9FFD|nr:16S rRNA (adenine(1518)-N(6)/adenine(1519)-N(6))-dimethyltransferase RsmA [Halorussus vallis]USZ76358.1 16S rRNA (adenine(1518)-N(6)/adenine(1519)-N(6))-dimethyltransferase RsmA [Halorussus vallis]